MYVCLYLTYIHTDHSDEVEFHEMLSPSFTLSHIETYLHQDPSSYRNSIPLFKQAQLSVSVSVSVFVSVSVSDSLSLSLPLSLTHTLSFSLPRSLGLFQACSSKNNTTPLILHTHAHSYISHTQSCECRVASSRKDHCMHTHRRRHVCIHTQRHTHTRTHDISSRVNAQ